MVIRKKIYGLGCLKRRRQEKWLGGDDHWAAYQVSVNTTEEVAVPPGPDTLNGLKQAGKEEKSWPKNSGFSVH
jgi:hypothetical protein